MIQYSTALEDLAGHRAEDIQGELPIVRTLLNQCEACGLAESGPHLLKLTRQDLSEDRAHADVREKVSVFANPGASGSIIAGFGIIERELHEPRKRYRAVGLDLRNNLTVRE